MAWKTAFHSDLAAQAVRLGRSESVDIRIPRRTLSRLQAAITPLEDGTFRLSRVDFVSHAGLGAIVKCLTRLHRLKGDLRLAGLSP